MVLERILRMHRVGLRIQNHFFDDFCICHLLASKLLYILKENHMKKIGLLALTIILIIGVLSGCKETAELEDNSAFQPDQNRGMLKFLVSADSSATSGPVLGAKEEIISLVVTIENLDVHRTGDGDAGWKSLPITDGTFDLIALDKTGWEEVISDTEIEAGSYNMLRFEVDGAQVTTESGVYEADVPSNVIKINVTFVVHENGNTEITMEIDPKASLIVAGNPANPKYILVPVLKITDVEEEEEEEEGD